MKATSAATEKSKSPPKRKVKTIIPVKLKKGGLSRFGYHANLSLRSRHIALLKAARSEGFVPIIQRLNLTATFSKNRAPGYSRIFKMDQKWLSEYYAKQKETSSNRRSVGVGSPGGSGSSTLRARIASPVPMDEDEEDEYTDTDTTTTEEDDE